MNGITALNARNERKPTTVQNARNRDIGLFGQPFKMLWGTVQNAILIVGYNLKKCSKISGNFN
jgi:hypothetical protein